MLRVPYVLNKFPFHVYPVVGWVSVGGGTRKRGKTPYNALICEGRDGIEPDTVIITLPTIRVDHQNLILFPPLPDKEWRVEMSWLAINVNSLLLEIHFKLRDLWSTNPILIWDCKDLGTVCRFSHYHRFPTWRHSVISFKVIRYG